MSVKQLNVGQLLHENLTKQNITSVSIVTSIIVSNKLCTVQKRILARTFDIEDDKPLQPTPTSSVCEQSEVFHPLLEQLIRWLSLPVHRA